jgi:hypothetical protein
LQALTGVLGVVLPTGADEGGAGGSDLASDRAPLRLTVKDLGPLGTGSNMFRTGLVHSSGVVSVGTYGPAPAHVWKYDPGTGKLTQVGSPGEYQLDSMVEAPNGKVYIGTAYNAIVYELDPAAGQIRSLGTPPVNSTSWIFTLIRTRDGEIYGAKGVGVYDVGRRKVVARAELPAALAAAVPDARAVYLVLADTSLLSATVAADGTLATKHLAADFGPVDRGCFLLPRSRCLVGVAGDGSVKRFDPHSGAVGRSPGMVPPGAGPAVHPTEDVWYYAGRRVLRYAFGSAADGVQGVDR